MIRDKTEYLEYLLEDDRVNGTDHGVWRYLSFTRKYLRTLRKYEYIKNCHKGHSLSELIVRYRLYRLSVKTGISIPANTFGKGLKIPHHGTIVVNYSARFGDYCVIQAGVNISEKVQGGNHIYFGTGSKIMVGCHLANDIIVGANAVVTKDFLEDNICLGGVPASKISNRGFLDRDDV